MPTKPELLDRLSFILDALYAPVTCSEDFDEVACEVEERVAVAEGKRALDPMADDASDTRNTELAVTVRRALLERCETLLGAVYSTALISEDVNAIHGAVELRNERAANRRSVDIANSEAPTRPIDMREGKVPP